MARQAENTLHSLAAGFQQNVDASEYEVIAVENSSDDELGESRALAQGDNIRYFYRRETGVSPVPALNFAFEQCRGEMIGIIVDGARMVSPRVLEHVLMARRIFDYPLVVVPGYHIGDQEHHFNKTSGYNEQVEVELLTKTDWKNNGYDLFKISVFSGANPKGFLGRFLESNCLFCRRESFERIGRADPRFVLPGGGSVNIYMYHALTRLPESRLVVLAGEGSFHQFHGGVTTEEVDDRDERIRSHQKNLAQIFGGAFRGFHRQPLILGVFPGQVQRFVRMSANDAEQHHNFCRARSSPEWDLAP